MPTKPNKRLEYALLALILLAGLLGMLFYTTQKQGYHVDELYTYELTNYPGGFYALEDGYMDTWHDGSFYAGVLTPAEGQRFDYRIPWNNQKIDVHPPLYYCLVFTACSLLPGLPAPWVGLLTNYLCLLAGAVVLYAAARRLTGRGAPALAATAAWLLSAGVQGMAVFTRMYSLLMLEALLLTYCHIVLWQALQSGQRRRFVYLGLFAATLAGALTQYFYLVFCFFLCGLFALYLLCKKMWKPLAAYCAAELGGLAAAYLAFPAMRQHIFSGPRGQQAFASFFDLAALSAWGQSLWRVIHLLAGQFGGLLVWLVLAVAAVLVVWRFGTHKSAAGKPLLLAAGLALAALCYIILIAKVAPFEADRYYVLIYGPLVLAATALFAAAANARPPLEKLFPLLLLPVLAVHFTSGIGYLYPEYGERHAALADTAALPAVVLNNAGYEVAPDLFLVEFAGRAAVYQAGDTDPAASLLTATQTRELNDGFVVYGYIYDPEELLAIIQTTLPGAKATHLTNVGRCPVYLVTPTA